MTQAALHIRSIDGATVGLSDRVRRRSVPTVTFGDRARCGAARPDKPALARHRGFTLAESLLAALVLAIAVISVAATLSASHAQSSAVQSASIAASMAHQLMEEIAAKPLVTVDSTPGWPVEPNRVKYDSVNDYDGYTDATPLARLDGQEVDVSDAAPFTRQVTLQHPTSLFGTTPTAGDLVIVQVAARDAAGNGCVLHRLVGRTTLER